MGKKEKKEFKPIVILTSIDLEMNQPSRKIIQIGAIAGNIITGEITGHFSKFINPNEPLNPEITKLTGITQEDVDGGCTLREAYLEFKNFHKSMGSFVNAITWGGNDSQELREQLKNEFTEEEFNDKKFWCLGRRVLDAKTIFVLWRIANGKQIQGGLAKSLRKINLKFQGRKHNGHDDAVNAFLICHELMKLLKTDQAPIEEPSQ